MDAFQTPTSSAFRVLVEGEQGDLQGRSKSCYSPMELDNEDSPCCLLLERPIKAKGQNFVTYRKETR